MERVRDPYDGIPSEGGAVTWGGPRFLLFVELPGSTGGFGFEVCVVTSRQVEE